MAQSFFESMGTSSNARDDSVWDGSESLLIQCYASVRWPETLRKNNGLRTFGKLFLNCIRAGYTIEVARSSWDETKFVCKILPGALRPQTQVWRDNFHCNDWHCHRSSKLTRVNTCSPKWQSSKQCTIMYDIVPSYSSASLSANKRIPKRKWVNFFSPKKPSAWLEPKFMVPRLYLWGKQQFIGARSNRCGSEESSTGVPHSQNRHFKKQFQITMVLSW